MRNPPLLRGVGQRIPLSWEAVNIVCGAIAEKGDDGEAFELIRSGSAPELGEA
eukprot:CAMPEP_0198660394 /NCGR_PEP_ID=MMETSP1467-20131203/36595_1 /TAXON_ID=1462469 /ORGANISM="unid. sp., Strain CCMP2135" /LENGTH=52 /DNA_ID=CAMNT_0044396797 /DNA_START=83 /DNA_END=238 /DNA_ORIENTATION=+